MRETIISSRKNQIIKHAVSLINSSEKRKNENLFVAEGARLCLDAAKSSARIFRLFYTEKAYKKYKDYIDPIKDLSEEIYIVEEHVSDLLSNTKTGQGVFVVCEKKKNSSEIKGKILVMENLQNPDNLGAITRTGEALGINNFILLGNCCDPFSPKSVRSSMGAVFRINLMEYDSFSTLINELTALGYTSYAAVPNPNAISLTSEPLEENCAFFIGNEANGLTEECKNAVTNITIPMLGRAESLNASSAAIIIMWEMVRNV